jgi:uncharacterized protein YbjT (DUF2867 family)
MDKSVLIAGATGLVGRSIVDIIKDENTFSEIIILTRRDMPELRKYLNIRQHIIDFGNPASYRDFVKADTVISALGTTIKKAGSQEKFREVDYTYPLQLAEAASANKCDKYILISAVGADPSSGIFYNRVKGELERDLKKLNFRSLHLLQPSLLLGERGERRLGEDMAQRLLPLISFMFPSKYRPVKASIVAEKVKRLSLEDTEGIFKHEGDDFYK